MKIGEDGAGGAGTAESMTSLLNAIRRVHEQELDRGRRARVLSVEVRGWVLWWNHGMGWDAMRCDAMQASI